MAALGVFTGCASEAVGPTKINPNPEPGHAYLQIVGDKNVFLDNGATKEIVVKYVDDSGGPLAGTVDFAISGTAAGSSLSAMSGVTGNDGSVHINVSGARTGEAYFKVTASAEYATPVDWSIAVKAGSQPPVPGPLDVIGTYNVESEFNLINGVPGTAGDIVRTIVDLTDSPNDPATWILDQAEKGGTSFKNALDTVRPALDAFLNTLLTEASQKIVIDGVQLDIVGAFKKFGNAVGDVGSKFGLKSQLQIYAGPNNTLLAKHTFTGVFFKINSKRYDKTFGELNMDNIVVDKIPVTLPSENQLVLGDEQIGLSYGKLIVLALDNLVIPLIDAQAGSMRDLLEDLIPCDDFGDSLAQQTGLLNGSFWASLCKTGVSVGAQYAENKLTEALGQSGSFMTVHGTVRPVDTNNDRKVDSLVGGLWEGQMTMAGLNAALAKPMQTFAGTRMGN
jgi:hypothetical protein